MKSKIQNTPQTANQINQPQVGSIYDHVEEPWFILEIAKLNKQLDELRYLLGCSLGSLRTASAFMNHIAYPVVCRRISKNIERIENLGIEEDTD